jgi:hypothetical protein
MSLNKYIAENYTSNPLWFAEETQQPYHVVRVGRTISYREYLRGLHAILSKGNVVHKGTEYNTSKMILQTIKTIINFHSTYVLGRPISLIGSEDMVNRYNQIYRKGKYNKVNFNIIDNVIKYGDCFEYVYYDGTKIKSRLIDSIDSYPIYDSANNYIGFIEYYNDVASNIEHYTVFSMDNVEVWNNEGGSLHKVNEYSNLSGLPIHYKNTDDMFGISLLEDIKPIMDKIETVVNRLDDSVYTLSMNPLGVISGQQLTGSVDSEGIGYVLGLEDGAEFKWAVATLDSASIKLLLDTLFNQLWTVAQVPSIVMGSGNVSNVSEVSLKLLFALAHNKGLENTIYLSDGFSERHEAIERLLKLQGVTMNEFDYIGVEYSLNRPTDDKEIVDMLSVQFRDKALSLESYVDKSPLITDIGQEIERLGKAKDNVAV